MGALVPGPKPELVRGGEGEPAAIFMLSVGAGAVEI